MNEGKNIYQAGVVLLLAIGTITDLKWRRIWQPLPVLVLIAAAGVHGIRRDIRLWEFAGGILFGILVLFLAWLTREAVGYGDGLVVAACGAALGFTEVFGLVTLAMCFAAAWALFLLICRKAGRKDCFPFLPFLLAAQLCYIVVG